MSAAARPPSDVHLEREVKLSSWPGFQVPDLTGVVAGARVERSAPTQLDAVYLDTSDLRLIRRGITLRRRAEDGVHWTLKLPEPAGERTRAPVLARQEVTVPATGDDLVVPPALLQFVRSSVRSAPLEAVAHLRTVRNRMRVLDARGRALVAVDDDEVSVLDGDHVAARFREVEVELAPAGTSAVLDAVVARLRAAGAGTADPTPKLVRALGPRALAPPELVPLAIGRDATIGEVVSSGFVNAARLVVDNDPVIRLDIDPEGVHQARVGSRRLRSDLRTFAPVLDAQWSTALRDELSWLADELGAVRDADVLLARFRRDVATLDDAGDRAAGDELLARLQSRRDRALARLVTHLDTRRYLVLLDHLVAAATAPKLTGRADRPAVDVLPKLMARPWRRLRRAVDRLGPEPADEALHGIRILVKRARYAADVAAPVIGKPARELAGGLAHVQDVLGDHHDAVVAGDVLRALAARAPRAQAFVAGQLLVLQQVTGPTLRDEWREAWGEVDRKKLTGWIA